MISRAKLTGASVLLFAGVVSQACSGGKAATIPTDRVRLAWGRPSTHMTELIAEYRRVLPHVDVTLLPTSDVMSAVERGDAEMTVTVADVAYAAFRQQEASPSRLRAIAALEVIPAQLIVRGDLPVRNLDDLRGYSIATTQKRADLLLQIVGSKPAVLYDDAHLGDLTSALVGGNPDALLSVTHYPDASIDAALRQGARLLPIDGAVAMRIREVYPFFRFTKIPPQTYPGQTTAVHTVGVNTLYVCRSDLSESLVFQLTEGLFRALPHLSQRIHYLRFTNAAQASSVPIPLHPGAARYYRELELQ